MKVKEEVKYFGKEWADMRLALKSFLKTGEQDDLHTFRVQVKKLSGFLILMDSSGNK